MSKKLITMRMNEKDLELIDVISKQLSKEHKITFDRTKTFEYLLRCEYDKLISSSK